MRPNRTSYGPPATGDELDRLIRIVADLAAILRGSVEAGLAGTGVTPPTRALMATLQDNGPRPVPTRAHAQREQPRTRPPTAE